MFELGKILNVGFYFFGGETLVYLCRFLMISIIIFEFVYFFYQIFILQILFIIY